MVSSVHFSLDKQCSSTKARAGRITTAHGEFLTPIFMPVATSGALRYQLLEDAEAIGARILLANTYHLLLRPGPEIVSSFGGLHNFIKWNRGILTDSGGFQVFSLSKSLTMSEEGAIFRSYVDGATIKLTPERSIEVQRALGSDIMMPLDQCVASTSPRALVEESVHRTFRWAKRCLEARGESEQGLFGIVQGACDKELRRMSAEQITSLPFDGFAIGGLAVGEDRDARQDTTEFTVALLPREKPRYLMGVGTPLDLIEAVARGMDMFDCILPTSLAGQGVAYTRKGRVDLRRGAYKASPAPLDSECGCETCKKYSRAYLHQLIKVGEEAGKYLVTRHNLTFYQRLMEEMRAAIFEDRFEALYHQLRDVVGEVDLENPTTHPKRKRFKKFSTSGAYEVVALREGVGSIRHIESGEVMHSSEIPLEESRTLYLSQIPFEARCLGASEDTLVVWDVGLGAATNAMAALFAYEDCADKPRRKFLMESFECDFTPLELALLHPDIFPQLWHGAPRKIFEEKKWSSDDGLVTWNVHEGDFLKTYTAAPRPEIIFYDPFSSKVDSPLWTRACFESLYSVCKGGITWLITYSSSTLVRANLLAAGFFVARGVATGLKKETTIALTPEAYEVSPHLQLLGDEFLERWEKSDAKLPAGLSLDEKVEFEGRIRSHRQFLKKAHF